MNQLRTCMPLRGKRQTNELRKINTVMSTDLVQAGILEGRDGAAAVSNAEGLLLDNSHNAGAAQRSKATFRRAAGTVVGALRFDTAASRTAQEKGQWAVQQRATGLDGNTADKVCLRVQAVPPAFLGYTRSFCTSLRACWSVLPVQVGDFAEYQR